MERQSIGSLIKILSETMGQRVNRDCRGYNLTMQQMKILHFLKGREGRQETSQKDIQDHMRIAHSTVVSILRLMESKGFIKISVSERDKRMKIVTLTGQEESFVQEVIRGGKAMERRLVRGFSEEEQKTLRDYLRRMYENVTAEE
ncbi:MAG TPA: MarR family transcriptional regulator [Candidatus Scatomonas pullistercoris]|uniref:MarR family transcriptional regulator n=1 Tax=Candidatus Scatomonas pullistercoris TaxID=2840920 RepID=A0A9D1T937_9FIRM|nr:MarR family transcriptional regulator [Candidatus Scatomonas pullistercoris]